jgi:hypothetical protein
MCWLSRIARSEHLNCAVSSNWNMKGVLLLHYNACLHTSLCTCEVNAKMGWTVLHCGHSPDLAPSDYHLFGHVMDALCGCPFADEVNWNKVFVICSEVEARNFTTLVSSILLNINRNVLKMMGTSWENNLIIAEDTWIIHVNFIVIAVKFPEKKMKALLLYCPLYILQKWKWWEAFPSALWSCSQCLPLLFIS